MTYGKDLTPIESMEYSTISGTVSYVEEDTLNVNADYVALGHIHTMVRLDKNKSEFYSGAIINTNFSPNMYYSLSLFSIIVYCTINKKYKI